MQKWYQIKSMGDKTAEINIYGDIGDSWWGDSVTAKDFVKELQALDVENLTVRINSYGGSVSDGLAIYNAIKRNKAHTTISIDGVAVSIASLIAMAGDVVEMADNALMMIHAPWTYAGGNAVDLREAADVLDKYASAMVSSYIAKSGKTSDDMMAWLTDGEDHWLTAEEARAEGFVDEVTDEVAIAASFNMTRFKTVPAAAGIFNKPPTKEQTMPEIKGKKKQPAAKKETAQTDNIDDVKAQVLADENSRRVAIRAKFNPFMQVEGMDEIMAACLDDSAISVQAAVDKIHLKLGENMTPTAGNHACPIETGETANEKFARGASQAILARCGTEKHDPKNEFRGMRLEDVAKSCLERSGRSVKGMDRMRMISAALAMRPSAAGGIGQTTSDFSVLLENVMHKQVLVAYQNAPDTWTRFCKTGSVSDFRAWLRLRVGSVGNLDAVNERGEYKSDAMPDAKKESVSASRRGKIINITPEIIINDDIGYINDTTMMLGRAGKRTIEAEVYLQLAANAALNDGVALFHASHGNLAGSGTAPTIASIDAARIAMAKQKDVGGNDFLDIRPSIFVGGMGTGSTAREINAQEYNDETSKNQNKPNVVRGLFDDVIDTPRISGTEWYLLASPDVAPVIEVVFLDGQDEPVVAMEEDFNTAGVNYRVELPFGVGAIGYEGGYKNPGV